MSIIEDLRTYMLTFPSWESGAPLLIDHLGKEPTQYAIVPIPGTHILERYIDQSSRREFTFAIQSMESTADDIERITNSGFYETLSEWLESQTNHGNLPVLDAGKIAEKIEALGHGGLFESGESGTGIYQIQCRLIYAQVAP